ncbi:MAG: peptidylprolyl isomerase, partial [Planctomycetaceae bacterium]|nr:peptidylprolyl isomerase [Planctomycetaceae bacterium]
SQSGQATRVSNAISGDLKMQDASNTTGAQSSNGASGRAAQHASRGGLFVGGTLAVVVLAGIGMQVWRAQNSKAAEQNETTSATQARVDAYNQAVGRVNGVAITYEMLARECVERHGKEVLDNLINKTIIQQACAERGIAVSEQEVNQEIITLSKKFGLAVEQYYQLLEAERGLSPVQYRRDVVWPMLAMKKLAGRDIEVTRQMMDEAYTDHYGERVKARMIVFDNLRRAQDAWERLRTQPDEFERMARELSVEPNSRALGGTVPPIRMHSGADEQIRKAAFAMKEVGEISGIVQVDNRYIILKYEGRTEPVPHERKDVEAQLNAEIEEREVARLLGETFERIQTSARVDNHLTGETRGPVKKASATGTAETGVTPIRR